MFYSKPWLDALIVLAVILLFFGPKRLPALGRSLGHGMREFKDGITGKSKPTENEQAELEAQTGGSAQEQQAPPAATASPAGSAEASSEPATVSSTPGHGASGSESA